MPSAPDAPNPHQPPSVTIIHLSAADTAAWSHLPAFESALIALARGMAPTVIKSADRKILYRIDGPPTPRETLKIYTTHSKEPDPNHANPQP